MHALKSKTIWLALIVDTLAIIQLNAEEMRAAIPPEFYGYFLIIVGVLIKVARVVTTKPLKEK